MKRQAPLSIEELIKQKNEQGISFKRPKFLTRGERENAESSNNNGETRKYIEKKRIVNINDEEPAVSVKTQERKRNRCFKFEWDATEDTTNKNDYIYSASMNKNNAVVGAAQGGGQETRRQRQLALEEQRLKKNREQWEEKGWWEKPLEKMTARDWRILKDDFEISTQGVEIPNPLRSWKESNIPRPLLDTVAKLRYKDPTNIQRAAIPLAMAGRDVLGIAETGSGKTAAFVIPMLSYTMELPPIDNDNKELGPYAIVLAPTRELALQIEAECNKFCRAVGFRCVSMVGGHQMEVQSHEMSFGAEIVIATPGRLKDNLEKRVLVLSQCCYVVMDEADRMISMGFEDQINAILSYLPVTNLKPNSTITTTASGSQQNFKYRQTMMFTATLPPEIEKMADNYLRNPGSIRIGQANSAAQQVEQRVEFIPRDTDQRFKRTLDILNNGRYKPPVIVFMNHQRTCDEIANQLEFNGYKCAVLHGRKSQEKRERALQLLKAGNAQVLVATDVAGRGIDVNDVSLVINYQMSKEIAPYTHRIGRTGRAGKKGTAITFLDDEDKPVFKDLAGLIGQSKVSKMNEELRRRVASMNKTNMHIKD